MNLITGTFFGAALPSGAAALGEAFAAALGFVAALSAALGALGAALGALGFAAAFVAAFVDCEGEAPFNNRPGLLPETTATHTTATS